MGHAAEQINSSLLGLPGAVFHTLQQCRHHQLHTLTTKLPHDRLGSSLASLTHAIVIVRAGSEEDREDVDHIRLKQTAQTFRKTLESKQRSLPPMIRLLVSSSSLKCGHDVMGLESRDTQTLDEASKTICSTAAVAILLALEQHVHHIGYHHFDLLGIIQHRHQGRHGGGSSTLDRFRRRSQGKKEAVQNLLDFCVALGQKLGKGGEQDDCTLAH
mmetsp:Transcript_61842/g.100053  ORF Transcript_61842/g.100053 Transcript_61842/m.100053 type:complete len:215 (+) Transcript_61842:3544-4188(+)